MKEQLAATLENSKNYTLAFAELMPEKDYNFKPVDTVWNFREQLHHLVMVLNGGKIILYKGKKWSGISRRQSRIRKR